MEKVVEKEIVGFNNKLLSAPLRVPLIGPGEKVTYRLIGTGKTDPNFNDGKTPIQKEGHQFPGIEMVLDKAAGGRRVTLKNIVGLTDEDPTAEKAKMRAIVEPLRFPSTGMITYTEDHQEQHVFIERHNSNASNPHRSPKFTKIFEKVVEVTNAMRLDKKLQIAEAYPLVVNMSLKEAVSTALAISNDEKYSAAPSAVGTKADVVMGLIEVAEKNPAAILEHCDNFVAQVGLVLDTLLDKGMLTFDQENSKWKIKRGVGETGPRVCCPVDEGDDPTVSLRKYLINKEDADAQIVYQSLVVMKENLP